MIRAVEQSHDAELASVIRRVMPEFGADCPGTALSDPEVECMSGAYSSAKAQYFVVVDGDAVLGGAGFAPLEGAQPTVCELRKMYLLPEARGRGFGQALLEHCLRAAQQAGFERCYLETLTGMQRARALYERNGFRLLSTPWGATGHYACDTWYARELNDPLDSDKAGP